MESEDKERERPSSRQTKVVQNIRFASNANADLKTWEVAGEEIRMPGVSAAVGMEWDHFPRIQISAFETGICFLVVPRLG